jgi:uncharacterized membrane protein
LKSLEIKGFRIAEIGNFRYPEGEVSKEGDLGTRIGGFLVVLEEDIRGDRAERVIDAISMIAGVVKVVEQPSDITSTIAEVRARHDITTRLSLLAQEFAKG